MKMEEIELEALKLDPGSRARLARRLLESLDEPPGGDLDLAWADEAARRDAEAAASPGVLRDAGDVLRDARAKLR